jgi:hypothetical protein
MSIERPTLYDSIARMLQFGPAGTSPDGTGRYYRQHLPTVLPRVPLPSPTPSSSVPVPTPTPTPTSTPSPTPTPTPSPTPTPAATPAVDANGLPTTREGWLQLVNEKFNPGFEVNAVPSSLLDDTINNILNEQRGQAMDYLQRGKARGMFNDVGFNAGLSAIDRDTAMGRSDLSTLGSTVIDKYRTALDAVGDNAYTAASGYSPGFKFSLDPYVTQYNDTLSRANTNAGGDLRNLIGGKSYFDFGALTNQAGRAQGAVNLGDTQVASALAERRRQNAISRGLGSQGAF